MRSNVTDLRRDMNDLRKQIDAAGRRNSETQAAKYPSIITDNGATMPQATRQQPVVQDAVAEEISEPESLNLDDIGRQMVAKALERNGGNRKKAAKELGISDRTLYRRIKQYGLE